MRRKIYLHGPLADKYGGPYDFEIATPAEAFRALAANFKGFEQDVREGSFEIYRGAIERDLGIDERTLTMELGREQEIHIVPAIAGARKGTAKAIIGTMIMIAAIALAPTTGGASLAPAMVEASAATGAAVGGTIGAATGATVNLAAGIGFMGITYGNVAMFGLSMMVSGIAQMLSPQPKAQGFESIDRKPSFIFTGAVNAATQGNAVPLVYGRMRVGSVVVSAGVEAIDIT